jgi:hypothetical protein
MKDLLSISSVGFEKSRIIIGQCDVNSEGRDLKSNMF